MLIDHDKNGNPRAMLVSVSLADNPGPDGTFFTVFIPISEILELRDTDDFLAGHPWLDVSDEKIIAQQISRRDYRRIERFINAGKYIAISTVAERGIKSHGCRLDAENQPITRYVYTWRNPAKYLSETDIFWLQQFSEESYRYASVLSLIAAISEYFQRLSDKLAQMPKPKKKRLKAKDRRRILQQIN
jgi:hypothetical protein